MTAASKIIDGLREALTHAIGEMEERVAAEAELRYLCLELAVRLDNGAELKTAGDFYAFVTGNDPATGKAA